MNQIPVGGPLDPHQHMIVVRTVQQWADQARLAQARLDDLAGDTHPTIAETAALDPVAFTSLIEALVALEPYTHRPVSEDLIRLAGLVPVDQALEG